MPNKRCEHNKQKSQCKDCGGSAICEHNKYKSHCKDCGGSQICEHNKYKSFCKECEGSAICEHNKQKRQCKDCGGSAICEHNKYKSHCKDCGGSAICEHNKQKSQCKDCGGSAICEHNKRKSRCKDCGGSALCKSTWCSTYKNKKCEGYCIYCYIHLFPDKPITTNYKTKERTTVELVKSKFPEFTWVCDKRVADGCSLRRPDLLLDMGDQVIIVEIDENQHIDYDCSCENKRLMELSQDLSHRPIVFIRFNPDDYVSADDKKVTSCWTRQSGGGLGIKKSKIKEWNERISSLHACIGYWTLHKTDKTIEIVQLYYNEN